MSLATSEINDNGLGPTTNKASVRLSSVLDDDVIDIREIIGILLSYRLLIVGVTGLSIILAALFSIFSTPVYRVDVLLQVETKRAAGLAALKDITDILEVKSETTAEIEILKSRTISRDTVERLSLDVEASPNYFPVIGRAMARIYNKNRANSISEVFAEPLFFARTYAWGGEDIKVETLTVPAELLGKKLILVAGKSGSYKLFDDKKYFLFKGVVGEFSHSSNDIVDDSSNDNGIRLFVSRLKARPGTHFILTQFSMPEAISKVAKRLSVSEKHKKSGILTLTLDGADNIKIAHMLNTVANVYVERNISRRSAKAQNSLEFLEKQLPSVRGQVDAAEIAYQSYRVAHGSVDMGIETKGVLENILKINGELLTFRQERNELRQKFKAAHPVIIGLDKKIKSLENEVRRLDSLTTRLPETQQQVLRLERNLQLNTLLYNKLLNTTQELRVAKAGTVGNVRVIDYAVVPNKPIMPKTNLAVLLSVIVGMLLGAMIAFLHRALRGGIEDPDELERRFDIPVYASILHSDTQKKLTNKKSSDLLLRAKTDDPAIESIRSLRTTLYFTLENANNNIIMICGASPGIGKSFLAANLAGLLSENNKKVLLIDGDLRRGSLHKSYNVDKHCGLSDVIAGENDLGSAIKNTELDGVKIITAGEFPNNPSELLLHQNLTKLIASTAKEVDYIVIDTPPILAVSDAAIIGRYAATTLMVLKSNNHSMKEVQQSVKKFEQAGITIDGFILNDVKTYAGRYGYGGYVYHYEYNK